MTTAIILFAHGARDPEGDEGRDEVEPGVGGLGQDAQRADEDQQDRLLDELLADDRANRVLEARAGDRTQVGVGLKGRRKLGQLTLLGDLESARLAVLIHAVVGDGRRGRSARARGR